MTFEEIQQMDYDTKLVGALEIIPDVNDDQLDRITAIIFEDDDEDDEEHETPKDNVSVAITLGNENEFGIDNDGDMFIGRVSEPGSRIYLGRNTKQNFQRMVDCIQRMEIHAGDD